MFHREKRRSSYENSALAAKFISGEAVLFTNRIESLAGLMENNNIRIANPFHDEFQDVKKLVAFHFHEGNNVYLAFHPARPEIWHRLNNLGLWDEYEIRYFEKSKSLILGQLVESEIFQK